MTSTIAPYALDQIGTGTARFPSGVAIPTLTDAAADPYIQTRVSKHVQVECIQFWPQEKGVYPGLVLLHEAWGLTAQIKDLGARLACEGYGIIIPNLYGRLGGMVTANAEVADALMGKLNESLVLQDINSCCEFLNTRDHIKRNIHGVVGYGMGGSYALRFACQRKRLRAAAVYYGRVMQPETAIKDLFCPVLYHQAGQDQWVVLSVGDESFQRKCIELVTTFQREGRTIVLELRSADGRAERLPELAKEILKARTLPLRRAGAG